MESTPLHWTYDEIKESEADLFQGDILVLTDELRTLLEKVHKHFTDDKYLGFIIITQSCDLVLRKGKCKANHINLSVIKSLEGTIDKLLDQCCRKISEGIYTRETKSQANYLIERILNQNEEKLGLFYLHPEPSIEIGEDSIAMLRINIALRSEHYKILQDARRGRLKSEFRNKLGWLVGNLYSRAATTDWSEKKQRDRMKTIINRILDNAVSCWYSQSIINNAIKDKVNFKDMTPGDIASKLEKYSPPPLKQIIANKAGEILKSLDSSISPSLIEKFKNRLNQNPEVSQAIKYYLQINSLSPDEFEDIVQDN